MHLIFVNDTLKIKMSFTDLGISNNSKVPRHISSSHYIQRRTIARFQSAVPKIGGGKIASNLARLNARSRPKAFYVSFVQDQLTKYLENNQEKIRYDNLVELLNAARNNELLEGQLILEVVDITRNKNAIQNIYHGWIASCLETVTEKAMLDNRIWYVHVGVYVGSINENYYVVDPGGRDSFIPMMFGTIGLRRFQKAFHTNSTFYVYTPIIENQCSFNPNLILQRALGGIGTKYLYHSPGLTSEVFVNILLGGISEDTFTPVWQNQSVKGFATECKNQQIEGAKYFHRELTSQIRQLSQGIHLSFVGYINRKDRHEKPWFRQLIRSFVDLLVNIKLSDLEKCRALISNYFITLSSYNSNGETPLTYAARLGRSSICKELLDFSLGAEYKIALGADVNQLDANGNSALLLSFLNGQFETCSLLINMGANQNDTRFIKTLCDSYSKCYLQNDIEKLEMMVHHLKHLIDVEVFYNYFRLQATKEGHLTEYTELMDNANIGSWT